jgi:hypothetical protein
MAYTQRLLGNYGVAREHYELALYHLHHNNDAAGHAFASIGLALLEAAHGNISSAETICANSSKAAQSIGDMDLLGKCLHNQGCISHMGGFTNEAIVLSRQAVNLITDVHIDHARADLASMMSAVGRLEESASANVRLATSARFEVTRWQATMVLMNIATERSEASEFELYRSALQLAPLPPWSAMWYHWFSAQGLRKFGKGAIADDELRTARAIATQHGIKSIHIE